jgi:uncharacterized SAM-binding protein YcdF (DUF218 family)
MTVLLSKLLGPALSPVVIVCALMACTVLCIRRWPRAARGAALAALLVLFATSNLWFSIALTRYLELRNVPRGKLPGAQAIVVLSSDAQPAIPPQPAIALDSATANRLLYGAQLYREGEAPLVILSGGRMPWLKTIPPISRSMAEVIELMGVPGSAVIEEPDSANTYENAVNVKGILKSRHIDRILLVTSAMHMPRALALFQQQGIEAIAAPCDFLSVEPRVESEARAWQTAAIALIPNANNLLVTSLALKEFLGFAVYRAAGLL